MKKITIIAFAIFLVAGCQKESTLENGLQSEEATAMNSSNQSARVTRSISGNLNNAPDPGAAPVSCSGVFPISGQNFLYGNVSHMGLLKSGSFGIAQVCNITSLTGLSATITYNEIWVAANGDKLFSSSTVYVVGDPLTGGTTGTFTGVGTFTGGTGRFEGATGHWEHLNGKYFVDGTSTWSISGEVTY